MLPAYIPQYRELIGLRRTHFTIIKIYIQGLLFQSVVGCPFTVRLAVFALFLFG
jgi:hypothetical protein